MKAYVKSTQRIIVYQVLKIMVRNVSVRSTK